MRRTPIMPNTLRGLLVFAIALTLAGAVGWRLLLRGFVRRYYTQAYEPIRLAPTDVGDYPPEQHLRDVPWIAADVPACQSTSSGNAWRTPRWAATATGRLLASRYWSVSPTRSSGRDRAFARRRSRRAWTAPRASAATTPAIYAKHFRVTMIWPRRPTILSKRLPAMPQLSRQSPTGWLIGTKPSRSRRRCARRRQPSV